MKKPTLLLALIAVSWLPTAGHSKEVITTFRAPVSGFINHLKPTELRFFSEDGRSDILTLPSTKGGLFKISPGPTYTVINPDSCFPGSQNPMSMGDQGGLILAYPYLVGVDRVCGIDEERKEIRLLEKFSENPFDYFVAFAGVYLGKLHFAINGRDMRKDAGYLKTFNIDPKTNAVSQAIHLPFSVPDFSGPMISVNSNLFITSWIGQIEGQKISKVSHAMLAALERETELQPTGDVLKATPMKNFRGQSQLMLFNRYEVLFFNGLDSGIESYSITQITNKKSSEFVPACTPVQGFEDQWVVYCAAKKSLELRSTAELMVR
jgi:hypothetical protein